MNLILFTREESQVPLPRSDARAQHILRVLRRQVGDSLDVGLPDGPRGKATLRRISETALELSFTWEPEPPAPPPPTTLIIGLPRPQTARKILQDAAALGVRQLHFVRCVRSEPSYAASHLWHSGEWQRHLEAGTAQAFATDIPQLSHGRTLAEVLEKLTAASSPAPAPPPRRLALDNYEAPQPLGHYAIGPDELLTLALGPERGWAPDERDALRAAGFALAHLGPRVLRLETAVTAALAITHSLRMSHGAAQRASTPGAESSG
ncbi:hypothetical protein AXK11_00945 [Cephaloticoccus primus]|uniref:Ribosomal RNA small subunit methyltransferase E n=1 Tax=Cephaloticoccus primus TaxID=1548207 RepID=A0A139SUH4_9BACT|nr:RsmE family RNA methyltransferase [Cephaloticoccus primus]KXU38246.1 hypothetical protein AXK11_00945 [Cephaloticoccus primus]